MYDCSGKRKECQWTKDAKLQLPASDVLAMKFDMEPDDENLEDL